MRKWWLIALPVVAVLTLAACGGDEKASNPSPASSPAALPDAANATYLIEGKAVTLTNGKADSPAAPGSASRNTTSLTTAQASGDIDGDGKPDVVVVLTNSPGGTGTFYYVAAVLTSSKAASPAVLLGDRISAPQVSLTAGTITVDYLTRPDSAPLAATPSVPASKKFSLTGGELKQN